MNNNGNQWEEKLRKITYTLKTVLSGTVALDGCQELELKGQHELQQFQASVGGEPGIKNKYLKNYI